MIKRISLLSEIEKSKNRHPKKANFKGQKVTQMTAMEKDNLLQVIGEILEIL